MAEQLGVQAGCHVRNERFMTGQGITEKGISRVKASASDDFN
ncbi:hypothetical protein [Synechococcus sp. MIT S9504]|nr:hypothetical protein [Synechococcus sp. MIT S9504]